VIAASLRNQARGGRFPSAAQRGLGALLLLFLVIGAFALWIGVPVAVLWALGKLSSDPTEHLVLGLIAVPLGMVLFGLLLAFVNTAYLRISGVPFPTSDDESEWTPRLRGPLDRIIAISAVICLIAFLGWLLFGSAGAGPAGPW
jgi:hypothetical protein